MSQAALEQQIRELQAKLDACEALHAQATQTAVRQEQQHFAQRLHDSLCQSLGGITLLAAMLGKKLPADAANSEPARELNDAVGYAVAELHALVRELRTGQSSLAPPKPAAL